MITEITLGLAERQVAAIIVRDQRDGTAVTARNLREVRRDLGLKETMRQMRRLNRDLPGYGLEQIGWDEMMEPELAVERIQERIDELVAEDADPEVDRKADITGIEKLLRRFNSIKEPKEFSIDHAYLSWLSELCRQKDWSKQLVVTDPRTGTVEEQEIGVSPELMEAFADLIDKLTGALADKPNIKVETEEEEPESQDRDRVKRRKGK